MSYIKIGVLLTTKNNVDMLNSSLLNYGILTIPINDPKETVKILKTSKCNLMLLDFDLPNNEAYDIVKAIREDDEIQNIYLIGTSINTTPQFIKRLQNYNVICFLAKPFEINLLNEKCSTLIEKFKDHFPERKHVRIQPQDDEFVRASFKLKNKKNISAKVINISMGGLACLMYTNNKDPELSQGNLIEHIIFNINNKEIDVDARIISKKERFIGFVFTHFYNDSNKNMANYILKKVTV